MRILLLLAAIAAASQAQNDCSRGACYPPNKDLLLGRAHRLHASSTCGLTGAEVYCTPYQQRRMKCCPCDSRNPNSQLAHTMRDALSTSGPDRWWQSKKDVNPVSLELDMDDLFQLDNLVLSFKGPRPSAFVIERTMDNGRSWQPALYLATDCQRTFPGISTRIPLTLDDTYCYTLPPTGEDLYKAHTIEFSPLRQYAYVPATKSQKIEDASALTGLRVRLTELGDVPRPPEQGRALSRFYALTEMRVMGSCLCHGHANRCLPDTNNNLPSDSIQVHPQCDCQHNTVGVNCERCADFFVDLPWRPAEEGNTHTCKRCECNNHAQRCHFDQAVYEASGRRSGGVCEGCLDHTTGPKCDECVPGYHPNPRSRMDRPDACIRCVCSAEGSLNGGQCDDVTGSCLCKVNVEGPRCDRCKEGYYDLSPSNPLGCTKCECNNHAQRCHFDQAVYEASGWRSGGVCEGCLDHTTGPNCGKCAPGYHPNPRSRVDRPDACIPCDCSAEGSLNGGQCDDVTGSCLCKVNVEGPRCDRCKEGYYDLSPSNPLGCTKCECNNHAQRCHFDQAVYEASGWRSGGVCEGCLDHTTGPNCGKCAPGYHPNPRSRVDRPDACIPCVCSAEGSLNGGQCDDVTGSCLCKVNVEGPRCDRCKEGYYDLSPSNPLGCTKCECNNHSQRCHFDQAVYEASGRRSGGVCEGCLDHTTGPNCGECAPGYHPNPRSRVDRPDACIRCVCSAEGSLNGGQCDDVTGSCQCKVNVEGPRCDRCKEGYYDLSPSNPLGCTKCSCSPDGSLSDICDLNTGQCRCRSHFHGMKCDVCSKGYWKPSLSGRCQPCGCDSTRSYSDTCDQATGQCECRPGFGGPKCTECPENAYGDPLIGCRLCRCDADGTLPEVCDKLTGACLCRPGVNGTRCDSCNRGHCDSFPGCETCPSCFFTLDAKRQNLSSALDRLSLKLPSRPVGDLGNFGPRIRVLETSLKLIQNSVTLPPSAAKQIDDALSQLDKLRDKVDNINDDLSPLKKDLGLEAELVRLQDLLNNLTLDYNAKKDAKNNSATEDNSGSLAAIKKAYDESTDAVKKADDSKKPLKESADIREEATDLQKKTQPDNTRDLDKLNQDMASRPNLTPVAKQVCGSVRSEPCTPLQCAAGDLCPPDGTPPCEKGKVCVGALPLSKRADADVKDVKDQLDKLTGKITDAVEKLKQTQETTDQVRESSGKLSDKMKKAKDELENDLKETRDVVKELESFLSDPSSNLTQVQEVSDWILNAKLPLSPKALEKKLDELKNLAASLPDSTSVLKDAEPLLDTARKQLKKAEDARDTALGVKADVDGLLAGFNSVEGSLTDVEGKLQNSMDDIDNLNKILTKAKNQLSPAEKALDDASKLIQPMKPQLDELKKLLEDGDQLAQDAQDDADKAEVEAVAGNKDLLSLEKQLDRLKDEAPATGGATVPLGDRVAKLQKDAGVLANTTDDMTKALEGKADSLRGLKDEFETKSATLAGLEDKLKGYLKTLRIKANDLSNCRG